MANIGKSGALCTINLNEHWCDEERQFPAQIRLRMELLVMTLEDMETQRQRLQTERSKFLTVNQLEKMVDAMNKTRYYLQELEKCIKEAL